MTLSACLVTVSVSRSLSSMLESSSSSSDPLLESSAILALLIEFHCF
eukprot:CAMPEP_0198472938 /NCGR_PEP_ID=MMETSP1456-20131121/32387_1 /TAXON_ID=1461544 ORGANISM="Unidentified sp., Strain RCC1871" /NCGR_SAMPLE_ID=MMETSP1456 /ASSEMBLY_ACC=CAM_ASM_001119 /LENGTH=46 /DNA_ID= /DNA_START= /DNA_END= /DNA_ORIENTATION=